MQTLATIPALPVAAEHFFIMYLEMFRIPGPLAARIFNMPEALTQQKRVQTLFGNQRLYNGFLAAGIVRAQFAAPPNARTEATLLFLGFVVTAALRGALTANRSILFKQGLPSALALPATLCAQTTA